MTRWMFLVLLSAQCYSLQSVSRVNFSLFISFFGGCQVTEANRLILIFKHFSVIIISSLTCTDKQSGGKSIFNEMEIDIYY